MRKPLLLFLLIASFFFSCDTPSENSQDWKLFEHTAPIGGQFPVALDNLTLHWSGSSKGEGFFYCYLFEGVTNTSDVTELEWEFPGKGVDSEALSIDVTDGDNLKAIHHSGRSFLIQVLSQTMDGQVESLALKFRETTPVQP